jgi:hypothetical protein
MSHRGRRLAVSESEARIVRASSSRPWPRRRPSGSRLPTIGTLLAHRNRISGREESETARSSLSPITRLRLPRRIEDDLCGDTDAACLGSSAKRQTLFREVNERIADLSAGLDDDATQGLICECSRSGCTEIVSVPIEIYARVRDDPTLFLLVTGHQDPDREAVIDDSAPT